jgi:hypothetical protein
MTTLMAQLNRGERACLLTFCPIQGMFGSFDSYNAKLLNYNVPAEVEKIVSQ